MRGHDQRQFYRVLMDQELEAGLAEGAWARYQSRAAGCLRPQEEFELERAPTKPRRAAPGERVAASAFIHDRSMAMLSRPEGMALLEFEYQSLEKALREVGAVDIHRTAPVPEFMRAGSTIAVYGVGGPPEASHSNFVAGLLEDNAEASAIARAHVMAGERVSELTWRVCSGAYVDPLRRTATQLAAFLADYIAHPSALMFHEAAHRERESWRQEFLGVWPPAHRARISPETYEQWRGNTNTGTGVFTLEAFSEAMRVARARGLGECAVCGDPADHDGRPHSEAAAHSRRRR